MREVQSVKGRAGRELAALSVFFNLFLMLFSALFLTQAHTHTHTKPRTDTRRLAISFSCCYCCCCCPGTLSVSLVCCCRCCRAFVARIYHLCIVHCIVRTLLYSLSPLPSLASLASVCLLSSHLCFVSFVLQRPLNAYLCISLHCIYI